MMETLKLEEFTRMVITLWALWHARRKMIHEDLLQSPLSTHHFIESFIQDLYVSVQKKGRKQGGNKATAPRWCPPTAGECKINADAAVAKTACRGAVGVVCRSFNG
jgi:hypothetical protein